MDIDELRDVLTEVFSRTWLDTVIDVVTIGLSLVSMVVAIWVACIYRNQSKIFRQQSKINEIQLEMYKEEILAKKFSFLPRFVLSSRLSGINGAYQLREI